MNISPKITTAIGRSILQVQKHSPIILTAAGVVGVVTAGVLAARATLKLEDTLDHAAVRIDNFKAHAESENRTPNLTKAYALNTLDLVKLYGPSITLGAASLVCIISAQGILHKRNAALVVAYKGLEESFRNYRSLVVEEFGEEKDEEFTRGIKTEVVVDENGKKTKVKSLVTNSAKYGAYTFVFGPDNPNWNGFHDRNEWFLTVQQDYVNDLLRARGHVFLNEVLERLGMEHTQTGSVTGWINNGDGDNYIDFRMYKLDDKRAKEFGLAEPGHILLDFNVDGIIYDKLEKP